MISSLSTICLYSIDIRVCFFFPIISMSISSNLNKYIDLRGIIEPCGVDLWVAITFDGCRDPRLLKLTCNDHILPANSHESSTVNAASLASLIKIGEPKPLTTAPEIDIAMRLSCLSSLRCGKCVFVEKKIKGKSLIF